MELVYLDNNATTRPAEAVVRVMTEVLRSEWGNPSSLHAAGSAAAERLARARAEVAALVNARPREVVFTSGGTEADHTALGSLAAPPEPVPGTATTRPRLAVSAVEHPAVLEPARALARGGVDLTLLPVDRDGRLELGALGEFLGRGPGAGVSVMWANNETGVLQPVLEIAELCRAAGARLHVDAVQAAGRVRIDLEALPIDLLSLSAHKFHGPKGIGALVVRSGAPFEPLVRGGGQEDERRAGTENLPAIVGFGEAARLARAWLEGAGPAELERRREGLEAGLRARLPGLTVHGKTVPRLPTTTSLRIEGVSGEALLVLLSDEGICVSTGSACAAARQAPSHVLLAMGLSAEEAGESLRLSLARDSADSDVERVLEALPRLVADLRALCAGL